MIRSIVSITAILMLLLISLLTVKLEGRLNTVENDIKLTIEALDLTTETIIVTHDFNKKQHKLFTESIIDAAGVKRWESVIRIVENLSNKIKILESN